ncbi:MAG: hypothetical protein WAW67_07650, partial [Candidatus Omnitrophota bacterium]
IPGEYIIIAGIALGVTGLYYFGKKLFKAISTAKKGSEPKAPPVLTGKKDKAAEADKAAGENTQLLNKVNAAASLEELNALEAEYETLKKDFVNRYGERNAEPIHQPIKEAIEKKKQELAGGNISIPQDDSAPAEPAVDAPEQEELQDPSPTQKVQEDADKANQEQPIIVPTEEWQEIPKGYPYSFEPGDEYLAGQNEAKQREIEGAYRQKEEQDKASINSAFEERERQESKKQKQADRNKQRDLKKAWQQLKEERTDEERAAQQANNDLKKELYEFEQVQAEATAEKKDKSVVETKETEVKDEPAGQDSLEGQPSTGILHGDDREDREAEVLQDDINKDLYEQAENYRVSGEYDKEIKIREEIKRNLIGEKIKLDNEIFENSLEIKDASLHSGNMEQAKKEILFARSFTDNIGFKTGSATTSTPEDSSPVSKTPAIPANIPIEKTVTVSSSAVNTFVSYIDSVRGFLEKYRRYSVYNLSPITYNQKIDFDIIHSLAPPFVRIAASLRNIINRSTNGGGQNDIRKNSGNEGRDSRVRKSVQDKPAAGNERSSVPEFNGYEERLSYKTELKGRLNISNIGKSNQAKLG